MKRFSFLALCLTLAFGLFNAAPGQQLLQESFENPPGAGYAIDPDTFCTWTTSDYFGRYTVDTAPSGLSVGLGNIDGDYFIAGEDMDSYNPPDTCCLPTDATYIITLDALDITGYTNLHVTIAVNAKDALKYDQADQDNADYLKILQCVDGGDTVLIGQFTGMGGTNNKLGLDTDLDGIGDIEISDYANLTDYTFDVGETGASLVVLLIVRFESGDEEIVFDNVRVIEGIIDTEPPEIEEVTAVSATQVDVLFDEDVDQTTAEAEGNYSIDLGIGIPSLAVRDATNHALVHLTVSELTGYVTYTLTVTNVEDLNGNAIPLPGITGLFVYQEEIGDVIITEFMANPNAVWDENGEWFEIYNASEAELNLNGWIIKDTGTPPGADTVEGDVYIDVGQYFVFCVNETLAVNGGVPTDYDYVYGFSGWGLALSNSSNDRIVVYDNLGQMQDSVEYSYTNPNWGITAGASHQLRNLSDDNTVAENWCVAENAWEGSAGDLGTPGQANDCGVIEPGDLIITEIMPNPAAVSDANGEWFEIYNATNDPINLNGYILRDNAATHVIVGDNIIAAHDYFVFCLQGDSLTNGGVPEDYVYSSLALANSGDIVKIYTPANVIIDSVQYTSSWPYGSGFSMQLKGPGLDNDDMGNWCASENAWVGSMGDFGTPGAECDCGMVQPGDIIITEVMPNPAAVSDANGEWFEIYNATDDPINLNGFILRDNTATHVIVGDSIIAAHDYFVFCLQGDSLTNGGVPEDYVYTSLALANSGDIVKISTDADVIIDSVQYTSSWPYGSGYSMQLEDVALDNDVPENWCPSLNSWPGSLGDAGTPGGPCDCAAPPEPIDLTICQAREQDDCGVPAYLDSLIRVRGIVSFADTCMRTAYLQHSGCGLALYGNSVDDTLLPPARQMRRGDSVEVTGYLTQYAGLAEIAYSFEFEPEVTLLDSDKVVVAARVACAGISDAADAGPDSCTGEDYESEAIGVDIAGFVDTGTFQGNTTYKAVCASGDTIQIRIDACSDFVGTTIPVGPQLVGGILGQYDWSLCHCQGYQVFPLTFTPAAPPDEPDSLTAYIYDTPYGSLTGIMLRWTPATGGPTPAGYNIYQSTDLVTFEYIGSTTHERIFVGVDVDLASRYIYGAKATSALPIGPTHTLDGPDGPDTLVVSGCDTVRFVVEWPGDDDQVEIELEAGAPGPSPWDCQNDKMYILREDEEATTTECWHVDTEATPGYYTFTVTYWPSGGTETLVIHVQ